MVGKENGGGVDNKGGVIRKGVTERGRERKGGWR